MNIMYFHKYNKLVEKGYTKPLTCTCGEAYTLRATEDGDPLLQCFSCNSIVQPGLGIYDNIKAVVKEHS